MKVYTDAEMHSYDPAQGHGLPHDPFNAIVGPRPIGWISSQDAEGRLNLAPYSFFNAFNYTPPIIGFSSIGRKDTVRNIEATGEFAWNLTTSALVGPMNQSCMSVPHGIDEFSLAGLTPVPCEGVKVPRVAESPVAFACKLLQILQLPTLEGPLTNTFLVLGQVVAIHIARDLLKDDIYDTANAQHVLRAGGPGGYFHITPKNGFDLRRPPAPPADSFPPEAFAPRAGFGKD